MLYDFEHFTLDQLDRVVTLGATRPFGELQLTLLSLECYRAGFIALILMEQDHPPLSDPPPAPDAWEPPLLIRSTPMISEVADDLCNHYSVRMRAGAGGGVGPDRIGVRFVHCFSPALDPAAQTLSFTVNQVAVLRYDADGAPTLDGADVMGGPWPLSFALPVPQEARQ
jgi:hypothetical protein